MIARGGGGVDCGVEPGDEPMSDTIYVNSEPMNLRQLARIEPASIRTLDASGCTGLTVLPDLPACRYLNADGCTKLAALPALPACLYLDASGCTGLTVLPDLPACETLYAGGCTGLAVIDAGQDSREYHFHGVPLRIGWRICAGCRIKTVAEARAHWGPGGPSDRPDCLALVEKIAAEIERRENAR